MIGLWGECFEYFRCMSVPCLGDVWKSGTHVFDLNISINLPTISQSNTVDQQPNAAQSVFQGCTLDTETQDKYIWYDRYLLPYVRLQSKGCYACRF